jgi:hypothetical protein
LFIDVAEKRAAFIFTVEAEGSNSFRNTCKHLPTNKTSHPRRQKRHFSMKLVATVRIKAYRPVGSNI